MKKEDHHHGHHYGIDEEQCGGNAGVHVLVALEECERRQRHEYSKNGCLPGFLTVQSEGNVARKHYEGKERDTHHISEQQHGVGVHALVVERNGESRICSVCRGSECRQKIAFQVGKLHISNFDFWRPQN